jgi:hypothetical protein
MIQVVENSMRRHTVGAFTACFARFGGGEIAVIGDAALRVASKGTASIYMMSILAGHILCDPTNDRSRS